MDPPQKNVDFMWHSYITYLCVTFTHIYPKKRPYFTGDFSIAMWNPKGLKGYGGSGGYVWLAKVALVETDSTDARRPGTHEGSGFEWVFIGCDVLMYGDIHGF